MAEAAPTAISVEYISDPSATQALTYQENFIEYLYGQNCGSYVVTFAPVDAACDHSSLLSVDARTGTNPTNSNPFSIQMTLVSTDASDIKECQTEMIITSDGFNDMNGQYRQLPQQKYQFTTTVNPCQATLVNNEPLETMTYTLGDSAISQPFQIDQTPACAYTETVTLDPNESWISVDTNTGTININQLDTTNSALIGEYTFKIIKTFDQPDDHNLLTTTQVKHEETFTVYILAGPPVNVCAGEGSWYYVQSGSSSYTAQEGFASPDDDTAQAWRRKLIDDELAKIVSIKACLHSTEDCASDPTGCVANEHFRGFEVTWEVSGGTQEKLEFGDCSDKFTSDLTLSVSEEVMWFSMNVDSNDVEGIAFKDYLQNQNAVCSLLSLSDEVLDATCYHTASANGDSWSTAQRMGGRPVGFDIRMGVGPPSDFGLALYGEVIQQPVALKIIYNTCNCPASTYIGN